jgi:hypothetical protein
LVPDLDDLIYKGICKSIKNFEVTFFTITILSYIYDVYDKVEGGNDESCLNNVLTKYSALTTILRAHLINDSAEYGIRVTSRSYIIWMESTIHFSG